MCIKETLKLENYEACVEKFGRSYDWLENQYLYSLFLDDGEHNDFQKRVIKFTLLDRVYIANLAGYIARSEKIRSYMIENNCVSVYSTIVSLLWNRENIDGISAVIRDSDSHDRDLTSSKIIEEAERVNGFAKLIARLAGNENSDGPISFSSKYLHFHTGRTPIYDSHATKALYYLNNGETPLCKIGKQKALSPKQRLSYVDFISLFLRAAQVIYGKKERYTTDEVKTLDGYLYCLGKGLIFNK